MALLIWFFVSWFIAQAALYSVMAWFVFPITGVDGNVYLYSKEDWMHQVGDKNVEPFFTHRGHRACSEDSPDDIIVMSHIWHPTITRLLMSCSDDGAFHAWKYALTLKWYYNEQYGECLFSHQKPCGVYPPFPCVFQTKWSLQHSPIIHGFQGKWWHKTAETSKCSNTGKCSWSGRPKITNCDDNIVWQFWISLNMFGQNMHVYNWF